ncbi:hypothetical protein JCM10207_003900 [Rhodosporidiobolus poonsookiae]
MRQFLPDGPHLPPLSMFTFLLPLSLQCLLLHPRFPAPLSRFLRFAIMPLSLSLAFSAPYNYAVEPRNQGVGVNFVCGIMGGYGVWKALEWGFAKDLTPYTWVGFDDDDEKEGEEGEEQGKNGAANGSSASDSERSKANEHGPSPPQSPEDKRAARHRAAAAEHSRLVALRARQAATDGPLDVLRATGHLLLAMRGQGYPFCGTSTRPFPHRTEGAFLRRVALEVGWSHVLLVGCAALLLEPPTARDARVLSLLPGAVRSARAAHAVGETATGLAMGVAVFAALTLGYSVATLLVAVPNAVLRRVLPEGSRLRPERTDAGEYPPLFNLAERPQSVAVFWSKQWHSFFSRPFRFLAYSPLQRLLTPAVGKNAARALGVLGVFALSSWIHEYGLSTSTSTLSTSPPFLPPPSSLPFLTRWGGSVYFMAQGLAVVLEGAFTALTGRRVRGWAGTVWTAGFVVLVGEVLKEAWLTQGLVREVPPFANWAWPRAAVPLACLLPPPLWMTEPLPATYGFERGV